MTGIFVTVDSASKPYGDLASTQSVVGRAQTPQLASPSSLVMLESPPHEP